MALPLKNLLLDAYRSETGQDLASRFEPTPLPHHTVLYEEGIRPRFVHFLTSGLASMVAILSSGDAVEVGMIGQEGFPEAAYLLGPQVAQKRCMMQVGGTCIRMPFREFHELFLADSTLRRLVLRELQYENFALSQLVACNGLHQVEERLARWLLMVQSRTGERDLPLTQELLGQMLGARRSSVTLSAGNLQRSGLIEYRRGNIRIESHDGLKEVACECYPVIERLLEQIYA